MTPTATSESSSGMANVLSEEKRQQVLALGRLGWPLRRIEAELGVRRETASGYLRAAGVPIRAARRRRLAAKPASETAQGQIRRRPLSPYVVDFTGKSRRR